jgi:hypothetical protein
MTTVLRFLFRPLLIAAGLIFALSLALVMVVLLAAWGLRALWCKFTGKPLTPFEMRMNPRTGFEQVFRQAERSEQASARASRRVLDDVTDVEPKV